MAAIEVNNRTRTSTKRRRRLGLSYVINTIEKAATAALLKDFWNDR